MPRAFLSEPLSFSSSVQGQEAEKVSEQVVLFHLWVSRELGQKQDGLEESDGSRG